jgi:hypothetical protein
LKAFGKQARKGYVAEQAQSPQTIGHALTDSPAGLAAWMLDHDEDSYEKIARAFRGEAPVGGLTRDAIPDNLVYFSQVGEGGHFAAWEEPRLFAEEIRAAFTTMR